MTEKTTVLEDVPEIAGSLPSSRAVSEKSEEALITESTIGAARSEAYMDVEMEELYLADTTGEALVRKGIRKPGKKGEKISHLKKVGQAPEFVIGLEDLEIHEGESMAFSGRTKTRRRHRREEILRAEEGATDSKGKTIDEIRKMIEERNVNPCSPKFLVKPRKQKMIDEGKSLRLKTAISANPAPQVIWDKNGTILETGNKYSIYNDGDFYYLEIHHVTEFDSAFYNCNATNTEGITTASSEVIVMPRPRLKPTRSPNFIEVLPGRLEVRSGSPLVIECSVSADPTPSVTWYCDKRAIIPGPDIQMSYDGESATLKFREIQASSAGRYTCVAKNSAGEARTSTRLTVTDQTQALDGSGEVPMLKSELADCSANDGETFTLSVELSQGTEPIDVVWYHDNCEVTDSSAFHQIQEGLRFDLVIADAFPEDSGVYLFSASNKYGSVQTSCVLSVEEKSLSQELTAPSLEEMPKEVEVEEGASAQITTRLRGHPEPVVQWIRDGESLLTGERYQIFNVGNTHTLTIRNAQRKDSGDYIVFAENSAGSCRGKVQLVVVEASEASEHTKLQRSPASFTSRLTSQSAKAGHSVEFLCKFSGKPTPQVAWYKQGKRLMTSDPDVLITTKEDSSSLTIKKTAPAHAGEYTISIRNDFGEDLASATLTVQVLLLALCAALSIRALSPNYERSPRYVSKLLTNRNFLNLSKS